MKRQLTSDQVGALRVALYDRGTGLRVEPIGICQRGSAFSFDPFAAYERGLVTNPNVLVTGSIGVGKSTVVKMLLARGLSSGRRAVVLDPKGEYASLARARSGSVVALGSPSPWCSPFSGVTSDDLTLLETVVAAARQRSLTDEERYVLEAEWRAGVAPTDRAPMRALFERLRAHLDDHEPSAHRELAFTLRRLVEGDLRGIVHGEGDPIVPSGSLIALDLSSAWSSERFSLVALAAMALARQLLEQDGAGYLVVDEAWAVLVDPRVAHWLHGSWKLARARAISHVLVLHRWSDAFAAADEGTSQRVKAVGILRDCDSVFLFRQSRSELDLLDEVLGCTPLERSHLTALPRGGALVRYGRHRSLIRLAPSASDRDVIDTDVAMRETSTS